MRKLNSTQRNYIILGLCIILLIMGVGYAAFQSQLKISGTSNIGSNFSVKITGISVSEQTGGASNKAEVTTHTDTSATFGVNLTSPGDSITYDITVANQGTIDAVLKKINKTDASNSAIIFETSGLNENDELKVGATATMKVKVTYNPAVTSQPNNLTSTLKVTLDYEQSDGTVVPGPSGPTVGGQDVEIVESGSGLYADAYEEGRYIYKGGTPNNYITFNNETWRILSVEADGKIKIVRNETIGDKKFDSSGLRDSRSNGAGGTYCALGSYGCNAWATSDNFVSGSQSGTVLKDAEINTYLNGEYLNGITANKDKIETSTWNVGPVVNKNTDLNKQVTTDEKMYTWNGKVGLVTASEYIRTSNNSACKSQNDYYNNSSCDSNNSTHNWLHLNTYWWTLSPTSGSPGLVFGVDSDGPFGRTSAYNSGGVRPAISLSSNLTLTGSGTVGDPYKIA